MLCTIWKTLTSYLSENLPECEVLRRYDPLEPLNSLPERTLPTVTVSIDNQTSEISTQKQIRISTRFTVTVQKYITSQDEEGKRDEMDALLPIPEKIRNLCTMKSLETSAGPAKLLTSDPLTGEVFDTSFFIESELFVAVLFVEVVTFSEVHLSGE